MKVGIVVAVEINALKEKYGEPAEIFNERGIEVSLYRSGIHELYVISCGAGEIRAAAGTQLLISRFQVDMIFNFGVVGGLSDEMHVEKLCIVDKVVHYDYDTSLIDNVSVGRYIEFPSLYFETDRTLFSKACALLPDAKPVICASGDKFIADPAKKREMHETFKADICEMEAAGIILTCTIQNIPCLSIKMVSDSVEGGADEFSKRLCETSAACMDALDSIIQEL